MIDEDPPDRESAPSVLDLDHVFEALGHPRRRYVLYTLLEDPEVSLRELASKVAAWENEVPAGALPEEDIDRVHIALYHSHVPKLAEDDIVEFSEADETVKRASNAGQVLAVLESAGGSTDSGQEAHARSDHDEGRT